MTHQNETASARHIREYLDDNVLMLAVLIVCPLAFVIYIYFLADE